MKRIKILLVAGILFSLLTGCEDWLDVNASSQLDRNDLFKSENGYGEALTGVYAKMCDKSLYGRELTFDIVDILAGYYNIQMYSHINWYEYSYADPTNSFAVSYCAGYIENFWNNIYAQIANINSLLETIDGNKGVFSDDNYNLIKGEALGLRAYLHFDLLRLFGWGDLKERPEILSRLSIPYVTDYNKEITKQSTVKDVLAYIEADLAEADKFLPREVATSRLTFNYYALLATRARVAIWQGNKDMALKYAEELIAMELQFPWVDKNRLETNDLQLRDFTFSSEYLFGLNVYQFSKITELSFEAKVDITRTNPQFLFHAAQTGKDLFELGDNTGAGDYRYLWLYDKLGTQYAFLKLKQVDKSTYANRLPLIRKAEVYYMAAECLNETGSVTDRQKAINYLNIVREKRGIQRKLGNDLSQSVVQQEILKEWRKEILLEGQMFFYYKRRGVTNIQGSTVVMNDNTYVMPLPKTEVEFGGRETY